MEDKIKTRILYLDRRIKELEYQLSNYGDEMNLTKYGYIEEGKIRGSIISKEMEIAFLESLIERKGE
ncbi:hypothetical protein [Bacillus cereus group sp. BY105LC]|uniref:hypothetical protein n=1 Tax=Bacillus cereus group sp. BY105LC TaxID=3018088 RepID=UPI0022E610B5|nr:hypothetical protein [Bacillus cereus group sp. BY105LC]MDA1883105.1 hypothetical protein [Bacillus cereus group sp. BY105LC]